MTNNSHHLCFCQRAKIRVFQALHASNHRYYFFNLIQLVNKLYSPSNERSVCAVRVANTYLACTILLNNFDSNSGGKWSGWLSGLLEIRSLGKFERWKLKIMQQLHARLYVWILLTVYPADCET